MKSFNEEGFFWWPENARKKYVGFLEFDPIKGGTLTIVHGEYYNSGSIDYVNKMLRHFDSDHKIILGARKKNKSGANWTLYNCISWSSGDLTTVFRIEQVITGSLFKSFDQIKINELYLSISHLEYWVKSGYFTNNDARVISDKIPKSKSKLRSDYLLEFMIATRGFNSNEERSERKHPLFIQKYSNDKIDFKQVEDDYYHILNFITFALDSPVYFTDITISDTGFDNLFFKRKYGTQDYKFSRSRTIFYYEDIDEIGFDKALKNWFKDYDQFKHIYEMFFITFYTQNTLGFQFLSLAQALDSYTGVFIAKKKKSDKNYNKVLSKVEFKERKRELLKRINKEKKEIYKEWLDENLVNYGKFNKRITDLLNDFNMNMDVDNKVNLIKAIVNTRNAISHGFSDEEYKNTDFCYKDSDLKYLFFGVKMIVTMVFLRKIGFNDEKTKEILYRDSYYKRILNGKYKFEENGIEVVKK